MKKLTIVRTREGIPAYWESGGHNGKEGKAEIVSGPRGESLVPLHIKKINIIPNKEHALLPIKEGYHIVHAEVKGEVFNISIYRIQRIEGEYAYVEEVAKLSENKWIIEPPDFLRHLEGAVKIKVTWHNCKSPFYVEIPSGLERFSRKE